MPQFSLPAQSQMLLPMLEELQALGGRAEAADVIEALSDRLKVPAAVRNESVTYTWEKWGTRVRYPWRQCVHWVRQLGVTKGLIAKNEYGIWTLTDKGGEMLHECQPGTVLVVFETPNGQALWADAITVAGAIRDDSFDLIYQSPPYPIVEGRRYGAVTPEELVELMMKCAPGWRRGLKDSGSLVLNLKDCWLPKEVTGGAPERSIYIDKLVCALVEDAKFHFADRHFWRNPACGPTTPYVTVQKVRAGCDLEHMLWFSKTRRPYADARAVMEDAKASTVASYLAKARRNQASVRGESGQNTVYEEQLAKAARGEQIRVLPRTVQTFANSDTHKHLKILLRQAGLPPHPARMPLALARFWVNYLTKPGAMVGDFFGGHLTTAVACEESGRNWVSSDRALEYILGGALRFEQPSLQFEARAA